MQVYILQKTKKGRFILMAFNKVILVGNLTDTPVLKQTTGGIPMCNFSIAVNRKMKVQGGQDCDFINIVAWRSSAEFVCRYFRKGNPILVCGEIQTRNYPNGQGQKVYVTEVVANEVSFVGNKETNTESRAYNPQSDKAYMPSAYGAIPSAPKLEEIESDTTLPF
jgi:single-strand DNA-binding protein